MDSDFARAWCELVAHICHVSTTAPAAMASEDVRRQYSRTLMEIMLSAAPHSHSDSLTECANRVAAWHVGRARDYIHEHLAEDMSVTDIASEVGVTPRTLQSGFRKAFDLTPAEYIRRARVERSASGAAHGGGNGAGDQSHDECWHRQFRPLRAVLSRATGRFALDDAQAKGPMIRPGRRGTIGTRAPACTARLFSDRVLRFRNHGSHRRIRLTIVALWTRGVPHRSICKGTQHA